MSAEPSRPEPTEWIAPSIDRIFELEKHGPDVWVGESPAYPWGRIFGGLVIAQALLAATNTVVPEHGVHSLHGYFILGGDPTEPVRYEVARLRNGTSFSTRQVVARQSGGAIFTMSCSFQREESGPETQMATFPIGSAAPTAAMARIEGSGVERSDVDVQDEPRSRTWVRIPHSLPDDPALHACALAYISDSTAMEAVASAHPLGKELDGGWDDNFMTASLDHAMWFHRRIRADDWMLLDYAGQGMIRTRGLATGHVFSSAGDHLATVAQEGLIRELRR